MNAVAATKEKLLRSPALINAREAAIRLVLKRENCQRTEAIQQIDALRSATTIVEIFRTVMPKEYASVSQQTPSRSRLASKFFQLVDFPLQTDWLQGAVAAGGDVLEMGIPIVPHNPHVCENCCPFAEMRPVYQLGLVFGRSLDLGWYEDEEDLSDDEVIDRCWKIWHRVHKLPDKLKPTGPMLDAEVFFDVFARSHSPLKHLPGVVAIAQYRTGSIFLDFNEQDGEPDLEWSAENVVALRQEWRLAQRLMTETDRLDNWLKNSTTKRIAQALRLYHKARKLSDEKRKRTPRAGRALVRVL